MGQYFREIPGIDKYLRVIPIIIMIPFKYVHVRPSVDNTN